MLSWVNLVGICRVRLPMLRGQIRSVTWGNTAGLAVTSSTEQFSLRRSETAATEVRSEDLQIPHQPSTEQISLRRSETAATEVRSEDLEVPHLAVARGKKPLSLWDWKIWTMAKPKLWRYGDASNLYERERALSTTEWAACLLLREAGRMG